MTAAELIASALRLAGAIAADETPDATEYADGLDSLGDVLDNWSAEGLTPYARASYDFPLTPGVSLYTLGPGATWNMPRPIRIIRAKLADGCPVDVQFDGGYPTGKALIPDGLSGTITLAIEIQFTRPTEPTDAIDLPPGYQRALRYALAMDFAGEYGLMPKPTVAQIASEAKADLKRANIRVGTLGADPMFQTRGSGGLASTRAGGYQGGAGSGGGSSGTSLDGFLWMD
jgi:hypothetical protein